MEKMPSHKCWTIYAYDSSSCSIHKILFLFFSRALILLKSIAKILSVMKNFWARFSGILAIFLQRSIWLLTQSVYIFMGWQCVRKCRRILCLLVFECNIWTTCFDIRTMYLIAGQLISNEVWLALSNHTI